MTTNENYGIPCPTCGVPSWLSFPEDSDGPVDFDRIDTMPGKIIGWITATLPTLPDRPDHPRRLDDGRLVFSTEEILGGLVLKEEHAVCAALRKVIDLGYVGKTGVGHKMLYVSNFP